MYEDYRKKSVVFQSDEVWDEIVRIKDNLGIIIDYIRNDSFALVNGFDPFRIFMFGKLDNKWAYTSLDCWDIEKDIASGTERKYFKKLLKALNNNETGVLLGGESVL